MTAGYGHTLFTEEQIVEAIASLDDYETYQDVASLNMEDETPPEVVAAFAGLAKALKGTLGTRYGALYIKRRRPDEVLRDVAIKRLQRQSETGEIEAVAA